MNWATRLIKRLTNAYTRLWLRWRWRRYRRVSSGEYVKALEDYDTRRD